MSANVPMLPELCPHPKPRPWVWHFFYCPLCRDPQDCPDCAGDMGSHAEGCPRKTEER